VAADRVQQWLLRAGVVIAAVLLIRFAIDFSIAMSWWLALPFCLLVLIALGVAIANVWSGSSELTVGSHDKTRALLLAAIPLGFMASALDCTGLSLLGCSPFCTFVKQIWIPVIAGACAIYLINGKSHLLTAICVMSLVPLVPHCVCYNIGNAWWKDLIGASPLCYAWGFVVSVIAASALRSGKWLWVSILTCAVIIMGATGFFVAHHYFHFPW
jgi:hypothetical protein